MNDKHSSRFPFDAFSHLEDFKESWARIFFKPGLGVCVRNSSVSKLEQILFMLSLN